jgi:hypothetical protein
VRLAELLRLGTTRPQRDFQKGIKIGLVDNSKGQYQPYGCGCSFWPVGKQPKLDEPATLYLDWKSQQASLGEY